MEEIGALPKESDEPEIERKVIDLTHSQTAPEGPDQRRAVVTSVAPSAPQQGVKRPLEDDSRVNVHPVGAGGGAVDLRARIGGKGKGRFVPNNRILEVRKIPKGCNNIAKLNEHFSKFGNLVNLQVSFLPFSSSNPYLCFFFPIPFSALFLFPPW